MLFTTLTYVLLFFSISLSFLNGSMNTGISALSAVCIMPGIHQPPCARPPFSRNGGTCHAVLHASASLTTHKHTRGCSQSSFTGSNRCDDSACELRRTPCVLLVISLQRAPANGSKRKTHKCEEGFASCLAILVRKKKFYRPASGRRHTAVVPRWQRWLIPFQPIF